MKKILTKVLAAALVVVMIVLSMASCAKTVAYGSYGAQVEILGVKWTVNYTFKGSKVEAESKATILGSVSTEKAAGKYSIAENADGSMEITFTFDEETSVFKNKTVTYAEGDGYIALGGVKYEKIGK